MNGLSGNSFLPVKTPSAAGLTDFEWSVLKAALTIPFGETRSYAWVAKQVGRPKAVRAVGSALRKNPWPLIIPCHRVIKTDGSPGKYAGKDSGMKKKLIDLERLLEGYFSLDRSASGR